MLPPLPAPLLPLIPALLILLLLCPLSRVVPAHPLSPLLHLITPRASAWPRHYSSLLWHRNTLQLPLQLMIQDILAGEIELRSPDTLQRMISANGQLHIEAWHVSLSYKTLWPIMAYRSWLWSIFPGPYLPLRLVPIPNLADSQGPAAPSKSKLVTPSSRPAAATLKHTSNLSCHNSISDDTPSITGTVAVLPVLLPTFAPHILRRLAVATTLDSTPRPHLDTALLALQSSIPAGHLALLEFSSSSVASVCSTAWLLSVLPFIHPTVHHPKSISQRPTGVPPLPNALPSVITLLESGTHPCTVLSVQNVSALHAQLLNDYACKLEERAGRERFLAGWRDLDRDMALRAWRGEVFWARWEAACYVCGNMTRWVICMKKPPNGDAR